MGNLKFPCKVCTKSCKANQNCIYCDICELWLHFNCTDLTTTQFKYYTESSSMPFYCMSCIAKNLPLDCLGSHATAYLPMLNEEEYISVNDLEKHFSACSYNSNDLTLLHLNTRSLRKNIHQVEEIISLMPNSPDIIAITETKLNSKSHLSLIQLPNYQFLHKNSLTSAGSVAIYLKSNLNFSNQLD